MNKQGKKTRRMIKKHLGDMTPNWVIEKVVNIINEFYKEHREEIEKCYAEIADKEAIICEQHFQVMKKVEPRPYDEHNKKDGNWNYIHQEDVSSAFMKCKAK